MEVRCAVDGGDRYNPLPCHKPQTKHTKNSKTSKQQGASSRPKDAVAEDLFHEAQVSLAAKCPVQLAERKRENDGQLSKICVSISIWAIDFFQ